MHRDPRDFDEGMQTAADFTGKSILLNRQEEWKKGQKMANYMETEDPRFGSTSSGVENDVIWSRDRHCLKSCLTPTGILSVCSHAQQASHFGGDTFRIVIVNVRGGGVRGSPLRLSPPIPCVLSLHLPATFQDI